MIIIGGTYIEESVVSSTANSSCDILSLRADVHRSYVLQSTLECTIFHGFIIYPFVLFNFFFHITIAYLSSSLQN